MTAPPYLSDDDEIALSLVRVRKRQEPTADSLPPADQTPEILPASNFQQVACRYHNVITHVELATRDLYVPLNENQLWNLIARTVSVEWSQAYQNLQTAQQSFCRYDSGEEKPLGPIGAALEGAETTQAYEDFVMKLSSFTIIDEELRQNEELALLLEGLKQRQRMLASSSELTAFIAASDDILAEATRDITPLRLRRVFGLLTRPFKRDMAQAKPAAP